MHDQLREPEPRGARCVGRGHCLCSGFVAVADRVVLGAVKLDLAGCMSHAPWKETRDASVELDEIVKRELGCGIKVPFMILSLVGLVGVPDLGLTELGLVDTAAQLLMDVVLDEKQVLEVLEEEEHNGIGAVAPTKICCRCPSHAHDVHRMMDATAC